MVAGHVQCGPWVEVLDIVFIMCWHGWAGCHHHVESSIVVWLVSGWWWVSLKMMSALFVTVAFVATVGAGDDCILSAQVIRWALVISKVMSGLLIAVVWLMARFVLSMVGWILWRKQPLQCVCVQEWLLGGLCVALEGDFMCEQCWLKHVLVLWEVDGLEMGFDGVVWRRKGLDGDGT